MGTVEVIERAIQVLEDAYERVHEAKEAGEIEVDGGERDGGAIRWDEIRGRGAYVVWEERRYPNESYYVVRAEVGDAGACIKRYVHEFQRSVWLDRLEVQVWERADIEDTWLYLTYEGEDEQLDGELRELVERLLDLM